MKLGMKVSFGPGHIVLDGEWTQLPQRGHSPQYSANVCCGQTAWMDQDATWYGGRPRPRPHCVRWGLSSPRKGAQQPPPPLFGPYLLRPNGCPSQLLLSSCCTAHCSESLYRPILQWTATLPLKRVPKHWDLNLI